MANRRMGPPGPQRTGMRSGYQSFQGSSVSPWQGQLNSNNSLGQSGGLLGQLANPQQLAIALTNLLQPSQQMSNNPPSLLSLNTTSSFSSPDNFNRFGQRGRSDFRARNEPYNKNRFGSGTNFRSNDRNSGGGRSLGRSNFKGRRSTPSKNSSVKQSGKKDTKTEGNDATEENNTSNTGVSNDEDGTEQSKREWKDEKNTEGGNKTDDENPDAGEKEPQNVKEDENDNSYECIPSKYLQCFVCNKLMWDAESFEKHIRGRAHKMMLESLEDNFHIVVNILREYMRVGEERNAIELNRMERQNKSGFTRKFQGQQSHCNMCELKFAGQIVLHRKSEGHQRLKRFLHPKCSLCSKEFPSRMGWVEHRLSVEHLKKFSQQAESKTGAEYGSIIETECDLNLDQVIDESIEVENDADVITELDDELVNFRNRTPAYKRSRALATKSLVPFTGFMCTVCNRSFENEEFAQAHLKTESHYHNFIEAIKIRFKKQQKLEEAKKKEEESRKRKREQDENEGKSEDVDEQNEDGTDHEKMDSSELDEGTGENQNEHEFEDVDEDASEQEKNDENAENGLQDDYDPENPSKDDDDCIQEGVDEHSSSGIELNASMTEVENEDEVRQEAPQIPSGGQAPKTSVIKTVGAQGNPATRAKRATSTVGTAPSVTTTMRNGAAGPKGKKVFQVAAKQGENANKAASGNVATSAAFRTPKTAGGGPTGGGSAMKAPTPNKKLKKV